jgi:hypothetical protein
VLFAIKGDGRIVCQFRLGVPNVDWEDITIDDQGHLYIGDIGNNTGALPVHAIYRFDEPDIKTPADKPLAASAMTFYALPKDNHFDAEGLFVDQGSAILVAKYLDSREAELFAVDLEPPSPLFRPARPRSIGRLPEFTEPATGAALSNDHKLLAVCSSAVTRVYHRDNVNSPAWRLLAAVRYVPLAIEGIAWDGQDLALVAEGGGFYRLSEKTWRVAPAGSEPVVLPRSHGQPLAKRGHALESK